MVEELTYELKIESLNLAVAGTRREIITKPTLQCLANSVSTMVEQLTHDPKFVGLNLAPAGTMRENMA
jgi:hypothetical protein